MTTNKLRRRKLKKKNYVKDKILKKKYSSDLKKGHNLEKSQNIRIILSPLLFLTKTPPSLRLAKKNVNILYTLP